MVKKVSIPETNVVVEMHIVDCGGFNICQDLLKPHWENANAVMLVYDVSNAESFDNLASWYEQIKQARMESAITGVVIASKTDLSDRPGAVTEEQRKALSSLRLALRRALWMLHFTSWLRCSFRSTST